MWVVWGVVLAMVLVACSSVECSVAGKVSCVWKLYPVEGDALMAERNVSFYARRTDASGAIAGDTLLANRIKTDASVSLPMSYALEADTMRLILMEGDSVLLDAVDVIVCKDNIPSFESVDCAPRFMHRITAVNLRTAVVDGVSYAGDFVDSVLVTNPNVNNYPTDENIRINLSIAQ